MKKPNPHSIATNISFMFNLAFFLILTLLSTVSCKKQQTSKTDIDGYSNHRRIMEKKAQLSLKNARTHLAQGNIIAAKDTLEKMRNDCYLALNARREGILLMDSIDLQQSKIELFSADSLVRLKPSDENRQNFNESCQKVQFYERKLQFDKQKKH